MATQGRKPKTDICWDFNGENGSNRKACHFQHECSICAGNHACVFLCLVQIPVWWWGVARRLEEERSSKTWPSLFQKGPSPTKVEELKRWLQLNQDREAASYLLSGFFSLGFRISVVGPRVSTMSKNLKSLRYGGCCTG